MNEAKNTKQRWRCVLLGLFCLLVILLSPAALAADGMLHVRVTFADADVSLLSQVIISGTMMPSVLAEGDEKTIQLAAGNYQVMVMLAVEGIMAMPGMVEVELQPGETKEVTVQLQPMPGFPVPPGLEDLLPAAVPGESDVQPKSDQELIEMLTGDDPELQQDALAEFDKFWQRRDAAASLVELLERDLDTARLAMTALLSLSQEEPDGKLVGTRPIDDCMDAIIPFIGHSDLQLRRQAAAIIGNAWYFPDHAVPLLLDALAANDLELRRRAAAALASWGKRDAAYSEDLLAALAVSISDPDAIVRQESTEALRWVAALPEQVAPLLAVALDDSDSTVRQRASHALVGLGVEAAVVSEALAAALDDPESVVRSNILRTMAQFPAEALQALLPAIAVKLVDDSSENVRIYAVQAVQAAKDDAVLVLPALNQALLDPAPRVAERAAAILAVHMAADAAMAVPNLITLLQRSEREFRNAAAAASLALGAIGAPAVPALVDVLRSDDPGTLSLAAAALGQIGPAAAAALPRLRELRDDPSQFDPVRLAAETAAANIERAN